MDGLIFGLTDNAVLIASAYVGALNVEKYFEGRGVLGAIVGAGIGNTISDSLGAIIDPSMHNMIVGITVGCIIPLFALPIIEKFKPTADVNVQSITHTQEIRQ